MKKKRNIFLNIFSLLLFSLFSYNTIGQKLTKKESFNIDNIIVSYESSSQKGLLPINIVLYDTITGKYSKNEINDVSKIINDSLYSFNISVKNHRFILEFNEVICGHSYYTHYHVFEKINNEFHFTKEYIETSDRNGYSLVGTVNPENIEFQFYVPKEIKNCKLSTISSFYGYQEEEEPLPFLPLYEKKISEFSKNNQIDSLEIYCDIFILDYHLSNLYHVSKNKIAINNIGYYLEKKGLLNESVYVLNNLLRYYPNRIVAYINLGDAYWGLKDYVKAKQAYQKYIELMKASGKVAKIPKRVFERIKE